MSDELNETDPMVEWTYRDVDCRLYVVELPTTPRWFGYAKLADEWMEVLDRTSALDERESMMKDVEREVDDMIRRADPGSGQDLLRRDWEPLDIDPMTPGIDIDTDDDPLDPYPKDNWWERDIRGGGTTYHVTLSNEQGDITHTVTPVRDDEHRIW